MNENVEDFIYKKFVRNLLMMSKLGRQCVLGESATGYNFDHMYENRAEGDYLIGKWIDRALLNLPAVRATRNRRANIIKILRNEIQNHCLAGKTTRIVDLACGAGRYLTDVRETFGGEKVEIVGVDYDKKSLDVGKQLAKDYGIPKSKMRFVRGNVFHLKLLKRFGLKLSWRPNIVVASGLTVYFDDEKVREVLQQVYEGLEKGGLFLFCSQESNPSRKLMEKAMKTKTGAWVLYYRPSEVWRQWLFEMGYRDIIISRDQWSMYNLCSARKP